MQHVIVDYVNAKYGRNIFVIDDNAGRSKYMARTKL